MADRNQPPKAVTPGSQPESDEPEVTAARPGRVGSKVAKARRPRRGASLFDRQITVRAIGDAFKKLDPRIQAKNPVMFVVEVGSVVTTVEWVRALFTPSLAGDRLFVFGVTVWLWFTVLFANFAEAMAEGRGKAQADTLRRARTETLAKRMLSAGETPAGPQSRYEEVAAP